MVYTIVGLGNPNDSYTGTRHNAGRMVVDAFREEYDLPNWEESERLQSMVSSGTVDFKEVVLLKPQVFMNKSGISVKEAVPTPRDQEGLVVVHDDIDIPVGDIQIAYDKSAGGHNGVRSVGSALGTTAFTRLRVGIAPTDESGNMQKPSSSRVREYVLESFPPNQKEDLQSAISDSVAALTTMVEQGREEAMNIYNQ